MSQHVIWSRPILGMLLVVAVVLLVVLLVVVVVVVIMTAFVERKRNIELQRMSSERERKQSTAIRRCQD